MTRSAEDPHSAATEATTPPQRLGFRHDVQGLRAVAVVLVVAFHSGLAPRGGFLGVDVFFVISGFVISRLLFDEQAETGRIALGRFYARRVRRLLPALALVIVFVALASIVALGPLGSLRETTRNIGIGAAVYLANFAILRYQDVGYFDLGAANNPFLHTWTLGVEEQFYLFFPLFLIGLAFLARTTRHRRRVVVIGVALAAVASFLAAAVLTGLWGSGAGSIASHGRLAFYASPTRAWEFLAGVLVACAEPHLRRLGGRLADLGVIVGLAVVAFAAFTTTGSDSSLGYSALLAVAGAALVILAGTSPSWVSQRVLSARVMVWIGDRSYGWYLWHWPLMVFARLSFPTMSNWAVLGVGLAALVPTELSYRYVEQPIRRSPAWLGRRALATGLVCSGVAIVFLVGAFAWAPQPDAQAAPMRRDLAAKVGPPDQCYATGAEDDPNAKSACIWRTPNAKGKVILVGDSLAWATNDAFVIAARRAGYDENMIFRPGCPFADVIRVVDAVTQRECRSFVQSKTEAIIRADPALVVLESMQDVYVQSSGYTLQDPVTGRIGHDVATRAAIWQQALQRTIETFVDHGIPTVVVSTVPQLPPFNLELCPAWRMWVDATGCAHTVARARVDHDQRAGRLATRRAVAAVPGSRLVDFADDLCSPEACSTYRGGHWIYRDQTHPSPAGSLLMVPRVERDVIPFARG